MQKREKVLGAVAILIATTFLLDQFYCGAPEKQERPSPKAEPRAAERPPAKRITGEKISDAELKQRLQDWQPLVSYEKWGRDPFAGAIRMEPADSLPDSLALALTFTGVAQRGQEKLALINDYVVRVGEKADSFEVVEIHWDYVVLRRAGKLITLPLDTEMDTGKERPQPPTKKPQHSNAPQG